MSTVRQNVVRPPVTKGQCVIGPCVYEDEDGGEQLPFEDQVAALNPKIWAQSGDAIDGGGTIQTWTNRGTDPDFTQANTSRRPVYDFGLDGRNCAGDLDGVDDFLQNGAGGTLNGIKMVAAAFKCDDLSAIRTIWGATSTDGFYCQVNADGSITARGGGGFAITTAAGLIEKNKWHTVVVIYNSPVTILVDGVSSSPGNVNINDVSNIQIGANRNLDRTFSGCIGEFLGTDVDADCTVANATLFHNYLYERHIKDLDAMLNEAIVHLDNNDLVHTGTTYNSWANKVNAENLQVGNAGSTVVENYNGGNSPAVDTNGSGRLRATFAGGADSPVYAVYAGNINTLGGLNVRVLLAGADAGATANVWYFGKGTDGTHVFVMYNGTLLDNGVSINVTPGIFHAIFQGDATSEGYKGSALNLSGDVGNDTGAVSPLRIAHTASNTTFDATFSGILLVPRAPTVAERIAVNNYFAGKQNTVRISA